MYVAYVNEAFMYNACRGVIIYWRNDVNRPVHIHEATTDYHVVAHA